MNYRDFSDRELLERCLSPQRDEAAWNEFVRRFRPIIAGVVFNCLNRWKKPHKDLIDDRVHESFIKLVAGDYKALRNFEFRHENSLRGFLKVIASNVVQDFRRRDHEEEEEALEGDADSPEMADSADFVGQTETRLLLQQMEAFLLSRTTENERIIFWMHRRLGYSAREISDIAEFGLKLKEVEYIIWKLTRMLMEQFGGGKGPAGGDGREPDE
jgi:DNA-directed RNA polymerase specialized sigma24 family protein